MLRKLSMLAVIVGAVAIAGFTGTQPEEVARPIEFASNDLVASPDSYPVFVIRDELGRKEITLQVGESIQMCALARNIYTNRVMILIPEGITPVQADTVSQKCETARQKYTEELTLKSA